MKRIDIIFDKLKELYDGTGLSAAQLSEALGLSRANVSNDLNRLCEEGRVKEIK